MNPLSHRPTTSNNTRRSFFPRSRSVVSSLTRVPHGRVPRRCRSRVSCQKDKSVGEFQKLLNSVQSALSDSGAVERFSEGWLDDVQKQGRALAAEVEGLKLNVAQKTTQLAQLEAHLKEVNQSLEDSERVQDSTRTQLEVKTNEVEMLKKELEKVQKQRTEEVNASMERYRELEDTLAHVESELQTHSEVFQGKESGPVDVNKLSEIVHKQDKVFQNLVASIRTATEEKHAAEKEAEEAKRKHEEMNSTKERLLEDQELLSKELGHMQVLYAEKELEWAKDLETAQTLSNKLKEETVGLEASLALKDKKMSTLETTLTDTKKELESSEGHSFDLRKRNAELRKENQTLQSQMKTPNQTAQQADSSALQLKLSQLEVAVPALEKEIESLVEKRKLMDAEYQSLEKEYRLNERKCTQLEQRASILQSSMEEKSNRLVAAHKERRQLKSEVARLSMEASGLQRKLTSIYQETEKYKKLVQAERLERQNSEQKYYKELQSICEKQQEAEHVILYHQEHKNENKVLNERIGKLQRALDVKQEEMSQQQELSVKAIEELQTKLHSSQEEVTTREAEIDHITAKKLDLAAQLAELKAETNTEKEEKESKISELESKVAELDNALKTGHGQFQELKGELSKLQNELGQRQRTISARDHEVLTLKDDARLANERVEKLRGQIASMQTLNREMETEMAETDGVAVKLNERLKELHEEGEDKEKRLTEFIQKMEDMELKSKQSMEEFTSQVVHLEEFSKQQEALVENFFEEKQTLETTVVQLKKQMKEQETEKKEVEEDLEKTKTECLELRNQLEQSQSDLTSVKHSAAEEIAEAEKILQKAETVAQSVQGSIEGTQNEKAVSKKEHELLGKVSELENQLVKEEKVSLEATQTVQKLEIELVGLREEIKSLKEAEVEEVRQQTVNGANLNAENEVIAMSKRLSKSLAAEEAALSEIQSLRQQVKHLQSLGDGVQEDEKLAQLKRHALQLEKENESLRKVASKRNQILAESRHFIKQYLDTPVNSLTDMQP